MKVRKLKKLLKAAKSSTIIVVKDKTPASPYKGMVFLAKYHPNFDHIKFNKFGVVIFDWANFPVESIPYRMISSID